MGILKNCSEGSDAMMLAALLLAGAAPAADPVCAAPASPTEPWKNWSQSSAATAGTQSPGAPALLLGNPVTAGLTPGDHVHFAAAPGKGGKDGYGGLFSLSLQQAARVGIALSDAAWVDVVTETQAAESNGHGHGPDCSGIRKIVWFDLPAGRHIVQIAGAKAQTIRVMATVAKAKQPL
jgi:hypothetical protein